MGLAVPAPARAALAAYRATSLSTRVHVGVRWMSCPFPAVEAALPPTGRILEVGCGHGLFCLYAALAAPGRRLEGVDIDADKVRAGRQAVLAARGATRTADAGATGGPDVTLAVVDASWRPRVRWDAVVVIDVLYLLGPGPGEEMLAACASAVAPGGRLVVKEIDTHPAWKYRLALGQELAATRVARVTRGATVRFLQPDRIEAAMRAAGLDVERRRIDRGYPHPHVVLVGSRPAAT